MRFDIVGSIDDFELEGFQNEVVVPISVLPD
jgi:hypothetical protein